VGVVAPINRKPPPLPAVRLRLASRGHQAKIKPGLSNSLNNQARTFQDVCD